MDTHQALRDQSLSGVDEPSSVGVLFSRARTARGQDQRDVAKALGVRVAVIQALEEGAFQQIGAPVFVRGHLARYARLLGLPEGDILDWYKQQRQSGADEPPPLRVAPVIESESTSSDFAIRWFAYGLVLVLVVWLGWLVFDELFSGTELAELLPALGETEAEQPGAATGSIGQGGIPAPEWGDTPLETIEEAPLPMLEAELEVTAEESAETGAEAGAGVEAASAEDTEPGDSALAPIIPLPPETRDGIASLPGSDLATVGSVAPAAASAQAASTEAAALSETSAPSVPAALVLRFAKDCWVDIRDADGTSLAYGVMKAGSVSELSGAAPFSLVLGNAPAAVIEINGETVPKSVYVPQRGTVSRFVLAAPTSEG